MNLLERGRDIAAASLTRRLFRLPYRLQVNRIWHRLRQLERELRVHDELTGLLTQRQFILRAGRGLRAEGRGVLVLFDVDRMFYVNDALGHEAGHAVLRALCAIIQESAAGRLTARLGGDEFVVLVEDEASAAKLVEGVRSAAASRLEPQRARIRIARPALGGTPLLTMSVGIASARPGEPVSSLIQRADMALSEAKNAGRDCVRCAQVAE
jgi:diguanylate cyclase (GGDEF)-like protein